MPVKKVAPKKAVVKKAAATKVAKKTAVKAVALAAAKLPPKSCLPKKCRVRIRMYRQGLGDCFLLTFPRKQGGPVHMMIDCGVVLGTPDPAGIMAKVAQSLRAETVGKAGRGKIDVLVITHEHWDHLSGFTPGQAQVEFDQIDFDRLWMAWTEDENNALANSLRSEREVKKAAAAETRARLKKEKAGGAKVARMDALLGFFGMAPGGDGDGGADVGGTKGALDYLKKKINKQQTFKPGATPFNIPGVDGIRIYVLGPPEDKKRLGKTDPGKSQGYGLAEEQLNLASAFSAALGLPGYDAEKAQPFAQAFRMPGIDCPETYSLYNDPKDAWRRIDNDWLGVGERLALQLDSDTNNTSLVLAFEFIDTGEVLLFVGDAQAGNWLSWDDHSWKVNDGKGPDRDVNAITLLENTVFYKVGHHGSHNATLREKGLERMLSPNLVAMMPVDEDVAHNIKGWMHMPLPELCARLEKKCAGFVRTDKGIVTSNAKTAPGLKAEKLYVDYFL